MKTFAQWWDEYSYDLAWALVVVLVLCLLASCQGFACELNINSKEGTRP